MPTKKRMPASAGPGSPAGEPLFLVIGFLRRAHGVHGEMIMDLHTDFPGRIKPGKSIYVGDKHEVAVLETTRPHANGMLVKLEGYATPEACAKFRNQWVYVRAQDVPPVVRSAGWRKYWRPVPMTSISFETMRITRSYCRLSPQWYWRWI